MCGESNADRDDTAAETSGSRVSGASDVTDGASDVTDGADLTVRRAQSADGPALRRLQSVLREPSPRLLDHALRTGQAFVATAEGQPVGYVLPVAGRETHVAELVVAPAYRRQGVATRLVERVVRAADGRVTLFVHPDNEAARRLYEAAGFDQVGRRRDFYDDADALVMAREP